ncbi:peptidoglycan DD-metalloendopeptidase family protein [Ramlibacter terrae]|uniref:Peptidoglycan DD-metalloendopeptidase family protein n=1 Tax=Ramlibacter terrae TaxID=2732511 RepID=A0ABX6P2G2_9BURK|nr:peptidoglycan DD-metalloendopeptidase family protein [Ramlibacter terrae]
MGQKPAFGTYVLTEQDVAGPYAKLPEDPKEQGRMERLGYQDAMEALAERFHVKPALLAEMNKGRTVRVGQMIVVPDVNVPVDIGGKATAVRVDKSDKMLYVLGDGNRLLGAFPVSIGGMTDDLPADTVLSIVNEVKNPNYTYDPSLLKNPKSDSKVRLPPGPNNPVGVAWLGLDREHWGIHGTPEPSQMARVETNGCIRLTNWDVLRRPPWPARASRCRCSPDMKAAAAFVLAASAVLLHGCGREPVRTTVIPPGPPTGFESGPKTEPSRQAAAPRSPASAAEPAPVARGAAEVMGDIDGAKLLATRELVVPVVGVAPTALADHYDDARGKRVHEAIDIMAPAGRAVVAVDDGRIAKLFTSRGGGLTVYHFDKQGQLAYYYAHLQSYAPGLREGATVQRGEVIGYVGSTGNANPAAPHLHFAVFRLGPQKNWWQGEAVNPYPALSKAAPAQVVAASR